MIRYHKPDDVVCMMGEVKIEKFAFSQSVQWYLPYKDTYMYMQANVLSFIMYL